VKGKTKVILLAACAAVALLCTTPARAGDQDFTLVNKTGYDIAQVYASPVKSDNWGEDIMGSDILADGTSVDITFAHDASACHWDLKVVYTDKDTAVWHNINLCEVSKITVHWNKDSGETTATTE
jgi:hypothetical protein